MGVVREGLRGGSTGAEGSLSDTWMSGSGPTPAGSPGWCNGSEVLPHGLDHSSPPNPETCTNSNSSIKQQPDRSSCLLHYSTLFVNQPQGHQGTNGVTGKKRLGIQNTLQYTQYTVILCFGN
jgi:hypothetical protein